jgi:hypothetical protein
MYCINNFMEPKYVHELYNNVNYQNNIWAGIMYASLDIIRGLTKDEIERFHHDKMAQLSMAQKQAFTNEQKSHMNADQLAAIAVKSL